MSAETSQIPFDRRSDCWHLFEVCLLPLDKVQGAREVSLEDRVVGQQHLERRERLLSGGELQNWEIIRKISEKWKIPAKMWVTSVKKINQFEFQKKTENLKKNFF